MMNDAIAVFNTAVNAVKPAVAISAYLILENGKLFVHGKPVEIAEASRLYLLSVGKAAAAMAQETEKIMGEKLAGGLVVTKYDHALPLKHCTVIEASHPVPDDNGVQAAHAIKKLLTKLTSGDVLLCMISGGASALIADIAEGISLADLQQLSRLLLGCGASIDEINSIRKHICVLKGGQLLNYCQQAQVISLIISDVMGDDLSVIASGLTVPDTSTFKDAWKVIQKYQLEEKLPVAIKTHLKKGTDQLINDTPKPGEAIFERVRNDIISNNQKALDAAVAFAEKAGYHTRVIQTSLQGEASDQARMFVNHLLTYNGPKPACLLMGGETTVTIKGNGKGGRNQEFVLAALDELIKKDVSPEGFPVVLSGGTDGTDGPTDAAGAVIDHTIIQRLNKTKLKSDTYLKNNDAYSFFQQLDGLLITGPTQTNVMDVVVGLIN